MLDIFKEEAQENYEALRSNFQQWKHSAYDLTFLTEFRRACHTLKGSGRMVEAVVIGEIFWEYESLLNQVLEGKIKQSKRLELQLQQLLDYIDGHEQELLYAKEINTTVSELILDAQKFANVENQTVASLPKGKEVVEKLVEAHVPGQVAGIFLEELLELSDAFEVSVQRLHTDAQDHGALNDAKRHLHTIKGGARMSGFSDLGNLCHVTETVLQEFEERSFVNEVAVLACVQKVSDMLFVASDELAQGKKAPDFSHLLAEFETIFDIDVQVQPVPENAIPVGQSANPDISDNVAPEAKSAVVLSETAGAQQVDDEHSQEGAARDATSAAPVPALKKHTPSADDPMREIFLEELVELLEAFEEATQTLIHTPDDAEAIANAERYLHTIKGGANMVGLQAIGDLTHAGESLLNQLSNGKVDHYEGVINCLQEVSDQLTLMYETALEGEEPVAAWGLLKELKDLGALEVAVNDAAEAAFEDVTVDDTELTDAEARVEEVASAGINFEIQQPSSDIERLLESVIKQVDIKQYLPEVIVESASNQAESAQFSSSIRVPAPLIGNLITTTNEWGHQNIRLNEQFDDNQQKIKELKRTTTRLREQIRALELETDSMIGAGANNVAAAGKISGFPMLEGEQHFDPLEMDEYSELHQQSRALAESMDDLFSLTEGLDLGLRQMGETHQIQERTCKTLQEGLISTRMTKISGLVSRLRRIIRQVSAELGKHVELQIVDESVEMDRTILEKITSSIEHLIRNSLAHGIETPRVRSENGKDQVGKIILEFDRDGPEIVIRLRDDGAGIDVKKLREKALEKGLIAVDEKLHKSEVYQLILRSGVSTAKSISQVAGRGVGMDVVNNEVNALGGSIIIDSEEGKFTEFVLRVPYNLATNQVMLVEVGDEILAIAVAKLKGMQRFSEVELTKVYASEGQTITYLGNSYRLNHLADTLGAGMRKPAEESCTKPILFFDENEQRVAYEVDEIKGNREVMLKPLGPLFKESSLLSSATVLGGGQIVLLLNAHELIRLGAAGEKLLNKHVVTQEAVEQATIMVIDDSITVRKITESLLVSIDYQVMTASDGVNALEVLGEKVPDLILLDIEMPRMDGFELLETLRATEEWKYIPVIMISSRSGAKHRDHAVKLGANGFIGKPWEAKQLEQYISQCLQDRFN